MFLMALNFLTTAIRIFECFRHLLLAKLGNFGHLRFPPEIDICQMVLKFVKSVKKMKTRLEKSTPDHKC